MRSRKFWVAVILCVLLILYAALAEGIAQELRVVVLSLATTVACWWIWCEARVDRAAAPLNLPEAAAPDVYEPPDGGLK